MSSEFQVDDEASVENEDDPGTEYVVESEDIVKDALRTGWINLVPNGWVLLGVAIVIYYLYTKYSYKLHRLSESVQSAVSKKDDDSGIARAEAMERSRLRLQEEMNKKAALFKEQQKQKKEEQRLKRVKELDNKLHNRP